MSCKFAGGNGFVVVNKDRLGDHDYRSDFPFSSVVSDSESYVTLDIPVDADWIDNDAYDIHIDDDS